MQAEPRSSSHELATGGEGLEVLLISLGEHVFGVPLAQVRYVAPLGADFVCCGPQAAGHFVFEGDALAYVPLWDRLGVKSAYAEYQEMQAMLPQRRQDHLDWMAALEAAIRGDGEFSKARNPRDCAFGKWFYGYHARDRRLALLLGRFEQPHAMIHGLADKLLCLAEHGQGAEALRLYNEAHDTTLAKLMQLFASAQQLVAELQRRVAIIVADGNDTCALGADGIRDIVAVPAGRLKRGTTGGGGAKHLGGLVVLDERSVVPLLDWRTFCATADTAAA